MAAEKKRTTTKKTTKAPAKSTKGRSNSAPKRNTSAAKRSQPAPKPFISPRVAAIIYWAMAAFFVVMVIVKGENYWVPIRSFFFGVFGFGMFLIPLFLIYMGVMTGKEKYVAHYKTKVFCGILTILFFGALIYAITAPHNAYSGYFNAMIMQFKESADSAVYITFGSGILGTILGYPLVLFGGKTIAICISIIAVAALIFILAHFSVKDIAAAAARKMNKFKEANELRRQYNREKRERQREKYEEEEYRRQLEAEKAIAEASIVPKSSTAIDIPLDDTKVKTKKKKHIQEQKGIDVDIADSNEPNAVDKDLSEDLINIIKRASKPIGEEGKTTVEDIASDISSEQTVADSVPDKKQNDSANTAAVTNESESKKDSKKNGKTEIPQEFDGLGYTPDSTDKTEKKKYEFPPVQLLKYQENKNDANAQKEMQNNSRKLVETLKSFGVNARIVNICRGPSVTRYELQPAPGVKISKITNLSDDIALNLAANGVRIEAPIPGKAAVGIEVPNKVVSMVSMRELIDSDKFKKAKSKLTCVLGRDISGEIVIADLAKMPHLLIAGTTGSGKSVCVNSILMSILYKATPDEVKLMLIDPKMVEFSKYKGIPHLLVPVVSDAKKAAGALGWAVNEMLNRYKIFSEFGCKDIDSYNSLIEKNLEFIKNNPPQLNEEGEEYQPVMEVDGLPVAKEKMSKIVIAIDELADLMMTAPGDVEDSICRIAQMGRAAGMHLILATQRPTVNVITGLIKANVPSRISLKVSSNMDSRTILDVGGGEKLIGRGDMLFSPVGAPKPIRVQGCYASDEEIEGVTSYIKKSHKANYNAEVEETIKKIAAEEIGKKKKGEEGGDEALDVDSKMDEAIKCVIDAGQASTSLLQRRLSVGYARAGRMIDDMERMGIIGPHQGSKPRDVLMTYNEWLERRNVLQNKSEE